ncbi:hypothetical protein [Frankia sp. Cas4]|uniref:hypothetical protein n=1 Tax=Frankia sp. Cas4 TaxID=3073927 RepID=UPI002AD4A26F|nr:hypothetical protein [Frankia sp. Cas4]
MVGIVAGLAMLTTPVLFWLTRPIDARPQAPWDVLRAVGGPHEGAHRTPSRRAHARRLRRTADVIFLVGWCTVAIGSIARGVTGL